MKKIILFLLIVSCSTPKTVVDYSNKGWTTEQIEAIKSGNILVGMTKEMVIASWGEAKYKTNGDSTMGKIESWSYIKAFSKDIKVVVFKDGKVESFNVLSS